MFEKRSHLEGIEGGIAKLSETIMDIQFAMPDDLYDRADQSQVTRLRDELIHESNESLLAILEDTHRFDDDHVDRTIAAFEVVRGKITPPIAE